MAHGLREILDKLRVDFEQWVAQAGQMTPAIEIVWNQDLDRFCDAKKEPHIKWIVVGHNPGDKERGSTHQSGLWIGRYFHPEGSTGSWTRMILAHAATSLSDEVLFLDKTPIFSRELGGLKAKEGHPLFKQVQERMAQAVYDLHQATGACVWIQGYPNERDRRFQPFFDKLSSLYSSQQDPQVRAQLKDSVLQTYHLGKVIRSGQAFPVETLFDRGLAAALPLVLGFKKLE